MNREGHDEDTRFFMGDEVENTPTKGMKTLFVVGLQDPLEIMSIAMDTSCKAIYFGANHSFDTESTKDNPWGNWEEWAAMIKRVLAYPAGFKCTLDIDIKYAEELLETGLSEHNNFIPMISVKLPYIAQLGYNATIKIDDKDFDKSNPGVWCHSLHDLMNRQHFTSWQEYKDDKTC